MVTFLEASEAMLVMHGIITLEELAQRRKQRTDEIAWLRSSLVQDYYPVWLVTMVIERWKAAQE